MTMNDHVSPPEYSPEDFPLLKSVFKSRWPITDDARRRVTENVVRIGSDPNTMARDAVAAMKVLVEVDKMELAAVQVLINAKAVSLAERQAAAVADTIPREDLAEGVRMLMSENEEPAREPVTEPRLAEPVEHDGEYEVA